MDSATSLMRTLHRAPESEVLKPLLNRAASTPDERGRIVARAGGLLADLRRAQSSGWVNQFLNDQIFHDFRILLAK